MDHWIQQRLTPGAMVGLIADLGEPKLATFDRRHFGLLRPRHIDALELLPADVGPPWTTGT